eukprot:tig00000880_g5174.t1
MSASFVYRRPVTAPEPRGLVSSSSLPNIVAPGSPGPQSPPFSPGASPYGWSPTGAGGMSPAARSDSRSSSKTTSSSRSGRSVLAAPAEPVSASEVLGEFEDAQPEDVIAKLYEVVKFTRMAVRDVRLAHWRAWTGFFLDFATRGGIASLVKMLARGVEAFDNPGDKYSPPQMENFRLLLLNHAFDFLSLVVFPETGDAPMKRQVREARGLCSSLVAMLDARKPFERALSAFLLACFLDSTAAMRVFRETKNLWSLAQLLKELNAPALVPFTRPRVRRALYVAVLVLVRRALVAPGQGTLPFGVESDAALAFSSEQAQKLARRVAEAGLAEPLVAALRRVEAVCGPADPDKAREALSSALQCIALLAPFSPCRDLWLRAGLRRLVMPMRFNKSVAIRGYADAVWHACPANEAAVPRPLAPAELKEQMLRTSLDWIKTASRAPADADVPFPAHIDLPEPFLGLSAGELRARMYRSLFNEDSDRLAQLKASRPAARLRPSPSSMPLLSPGRGGAGAGGPAAALHEEEPMCRNCILGLTADTRRCECLLNYWRTLDTTIGRPLALAS